MNKLYHAFSVYSYKGGELNSIINNTLEDLVSGFIEFIDWEDFRDFCANDENFTNMDDDTYFSLSFTQLIDMMDDKTIKNILSDIIYPGNIYAFDSCSDYEIYTTNDEGKLVKVNIVEEPGFLDLAKKALKKEAKFWDNQNKL